MYVEIIENITLHMLTNFKKHNDEFYALTTIYHKCIFKDQL